MAGLLENMYRYASRPVRDLIELGNITKTGLGVKRAEAPIYSMEELLKFADQGGSKAFMGSSKQKQYARDLGASQEAYRKVTEYEPIALKRGEMEGLLDYDRAAKNAAIAGSFMMPGIGSGLGGALATGAVAGGMGGYGGSRKGDELSSTLTGVGMGAALGGVGYGLKSLAQNLSKTKVNPKMVKGKASRLDMSPEEFTQNNGRLLEDMSEKGFDVSTPKKIANNLKPFLEKVGKDIDDYALTAEGVPDISKVSEVFASKRRYLPNSKGAQQVADITEEFLSKKNLTYSDVYKYTQELDKIGGGFEKLQNAGKTQLAQIMKELRNSARGVTSNDPTLNSSLQSMFNAMTLKNTILTNPEITSKIGLNAIVARTSTDVRPIGDALRRGGSIQKGVGGMIGKGTELLGRGLSPENAPGIIQGFKPGLNLVGALTGSSALGAGMDEQGMGQEPVAGGDMADYIDPTTGMLRELGGGQGQAQAQPYTIQDGLREAVQTFPDASENVLLSYAKALVDQNQVSGTTNTPAQDAALSMIGRIEEMIGGLDLQESPLGAAVAGTGGKVIGTLVPATQAGQFRTARKAIVSRISRALGEIGTLSDRDIERAINLIPDLTDTPESAAQKIQDLRLFIGGVQQAPQQPIYDDYANW